MFGDSNLYKSYSSMVGNASVSSNQLSLSVKLMTFDDFQGMSLSLSSVSNQVLSLPKFLKFEASRVCLLKILKAFEDQFPIFKLS